MNDKDKMTGEPTRCLCCRVVPVLEGGGRCQSHWDPQRVKCIRCSWFGWVVGVRWDRWERKEHE